MSDGSYFQTPISYRFLRKPLRTFCTIIGQNRSRKHNIYVSKLKKRFGKLDNGLG